MSKLNTRWMIAGLLVALIALPAVAEAASPPDLDDADNDAPNRNVGIKALCVSGSGYVSGPAGGVHAGAYVCI